jgi:hypothetical protein
VSSLTLLALQEIEQARIALGSLVISSRPEALSRRVLEAVQHRLNDAAERLQLDVSRKKQPAKARVGHRLRPRG